MMNTNGLSTNIITAINKIVNEHHALLSSGKNELETIKELQMFTYEKVINTKRN